MEYIKDTILDEYLIDYPDSFTRSDSDGKLYGCDESLGIKVYCKRLSKIEIPEGMEISDQIGNGSYGEISVKEEL